MRFGLFGSATARHGGPDADSGLGYKQFIDYNIEAEALGYQSTFLVEHHFSGAGQVSASLTLLTWLAAKTKTLRLGTAVLVLPWHNPVLLAEQAATIDLLSGGRLDFGVGKGYRHNEFSGFRIPIEEGEARFRECLDVVVKSWTSKERFSYRGKFWQFDDIIVEPPTAQKPHPPMWMAAGSQPSISQVAERGYNLLLDQFASPETIGERVRVFKTEVEKRGRTFDPLEVGVARAFYVAKDKADKEAALEARLAAQRHFAALSKAADGTQSKASIMAFSDTREASEEAALYGTPDEIAEKLESLRKLGVEYILLNGGGLAHESLRRFARELMPAFTDGGRMRDAG
jgi:alkanesulfonate monooxygenase SsuD/methylene tetrahydromethanopterin reductase-like flavin-dependent oxidoreductase (luciferase family)